MVYTDDKLGLILLAGTPRELEAVQQTLRVLDQGGLQASRIRWFELSQAPAQTVADELEKILQASQAVGIQVVPLKRLNGVLVFARTPEGLDAATRWVAKLDVASKAEASGIWVYHPISVSAESLAATLNVVLGNSPAETSPPSASSSPMAPETSIKGASAPAVAASPAPSFAPAAAAGDESGVRIGVSRDSNALIISAPPSKWIQIRRMLDEIDRTPDQVLIEAAILEVTLTDQFQFGVDWTVVAANGKLNISNIANNAGVIAPTFPGFSLTYLDKNIQTAVNALKGLTNVEIVSEPKLVTITNHTAKLQVGDQVPITIQSAQSTSTANAPLVTTTAYQDTGVILNVTPRISGDDQIVLDVDQQVSTAGATTSSGIDSPTIQQRHLESTLILKDGAAVALGGLISDSRTEAKTGMPWLQDIPVLGTAFKTTNRKRNRTELIVLMTAKIMRDPTSERRVMDDLLSDMKEIQRRGLLQR